jgi:uncharacterized protein YciI
MMMKTYIYVLKLIPRLQVESNWTKGDEELVTMHFNRLKSDSEKGIVKLAGRTDNTDETGFGIVIFESDSIETARTYMESDPCVTGGIMTADVFLYHVAIQVF